MNGAALATIVDRQSPGAPGGGVSGVVLRGRDRRPLAIVEVSTDVGSRSLVVRRFLDGQGALLRYYFQDGERAVEVDSELVTFEGTLRTRWEITGRRWVIQLNLAPTAPHQRPAV